MIFLLLMLIIRLAIVYNSQAGYCLNTITIDIYQYAKNALILYKNANNSKYMEAGHEISMQFEASQRKKINIQSFIIAWYTVLGMRHSKCSI